MLLENRRGPEFERVASEAIAEVVKRQVEAGVDVVNDGEASKVSFSTYVTDRLTGFESEARDREPTVESRMFPAFYGDRGPARAQVMTCVGPITWKGDELVQRDIDNLRAALEDVDVEGVFVSAASPGVVWYYQPNVYYQTHDEYIWAAAEAMKPEYDALYQAGFLVQLDCPDLGGGWNRADFAEKTVDQFRAVARVHVEALNHATRDIPAECLRMHVCWGNYSAPHVRDIPLRSMLDIILEARPSAISIEGANPRHEHEWDVFSDTGLPEGKVIMPGVIDSTSNYVEHPEVIAQRIKRYADAVGRENVIASSDCGFATLAVSDGVHPTIAWAKLQSLAEGARLASDRLW